MSRYAIIAVLLGVSFGLVACGHLNHDRGAGLYTEKRYFEAEYYLQRALRTDPGDANAKLLLALVYLKTYRERHATPLLHELAQTESNALVDGNALPEYANMPISTAARQLLGQASGNNESVSSIEDQIMREHESAEQTISLPPAPAGKPAKKKKGKEAPEATRALDAPEKSTTQSEKGFGVHILSVQEAGQVPKAAQTLKNKLPKLFGDKQVHSQTVDLGAKGVFHRVVLGPYPSRHAAEKACATARKSYSFCAVTSF